MVPLPAVSRAIITPMTVSERHIERLLKARHHNPFEFLGRHRLAGETAIRIFQPMAVKAWVIRGDTPVEMNKIHEAGFFEAILRDDETFTYLIRIEDSIGNLRTFHDPYSFPPLLSDFDLHLMGEGTHYHKYDKLGAHLCSIDGIDGVNFAVWAPNAWGVSIIGDFNGWDGRTHPMRTRGSTGIWELFIPGLKEGDIYKFEVKTETGLFIKTDPYGFYSELRPQTASIIWDVDKYQWNDEEWMQSRKEKNWFESPVAVYEVHLGSWMRTENGGFCNFRDLAHRLVTHVKNLGFTHLELLPVMEHPLDASWGYQTLGYFSVTSRHGVPEDFMYFVDYCHQHDIGVLVDWVPAHFPKDAHGLAYFDGSFLYEHEHPMKREHMDWGTHIFNYGRTEVSSFLLNSALFWLEKYHIDGLRVDAVASMLYLDYSRQPGEWIPNIYGGNENLEAIAFIKKFNEVCHLYHPGVLTIAEESTAWPMVSRPTYVGGLGFSLKWNMGWMHDILDYFSKDPVYRKYHHSNLTFALLYAFHENFVLVLSHDEVVHGKGSLMSKMPGDLWQRFANLRLLYGYMYGQPGKKMLFMGAELGQWYEWDSSSSLQWDLLQYEPHEKLMRYLSDLNHLYMREASMFEVDFDYHGFEWLDFSDSESSVISFVRRSKNPEDYLVFVYNLTPVPRLGYRVGVPEQTGYKEIMNSDSELYWGSNVGNAGFVVSDSVPFLHWPCSISLNMPPLGMVVLKPDRA